MLFLFECCFKRKEAVVVDDGFFLVDTCTQLYFVGIKGPESHREPLIPVRFSCGYSPVWWHKVLAPVNENMLHCVRWNLTVGTHYKGTKWKAKQGIMQSAIFVDFICLYWVLLLPVAWIWATYLWKGLTIEVTISVLAPLFIRLWIMKLEHLCSFFLSIYILFLKRRGSNIHMKLSYSEQSSSHSALLIMTSLDKGFLCHIWSWEGSGIFSPWLSVIVCCMPRLSSNDIILQLKKKNIALFQVLCFINKSVFFHILQKYVV